MALFAAFSFCLRMLRALTNCLLCSAGSKTSWHLCTTSANIKSVQNSGKLATRHNFSHVSILSLPATNNNNKQRICVNIGPICKWAKRRVYKYNVLFIISLQWNAQNNVERRLCFTVQCEHRYVCVCVFFLLFLFVLSAKCVIELNI